MDNQTGEFLGPDYSWSKASIELEDIQVLHGGVRVHLPSWTMSQVYVTQVFPGGQETKFRVPLDWLKQEKDALCQLFIEQDFLTIQPEERPGIPDEARPLITLTNSKNESHSVSKWAGVEDAGFDVLYQALLSLAERTNDHKPMPMKFKLWQKILVAAGVGLLLLLTLLLAHRLAVSLTAAWWPEQTGLLLGMLFLLFVGAPILVRGLAWRERKKSRENRLFTNFPVALIIWFLFFAAIIGCGEIAWSGVKTWWNDSSLTANDDVRQYAVFAYSALLMLYFLAIEVALIGPRIVELIDERF